MLTINCLIGLILVNSHIYFNVKYYKLRITFASKLMLCVKQRLHYEAGRWISVYTRLTGCSKKSINTEYCVKERKVQVANNQFCRTLLTYTIIKHVISWKSHISIVRKLPTTKYSELVCQITITLPFIP